MKCLVLGSNSFAGSGYVDYLLKNGFEVLGISRSGEPNDIFLPYKNNARNDSFKFYQLDLNKHFDSVLDLFTDFEPLYIVDFAGQGMVAQSWDHPEQWFQTNVVSKSRLYRFLSKKEWLKKYVRISTPEVYGSVDDLITEDYPYAPSTPYAVSHAATDMNLDAYHKTFSFPQVITRFANFYGAHQQLYRIIPKTIISTLTGQKLPLHGGGLSIRAFIHRDDVSDSIFRTMIDGQVGQKYHFSPSSFSTIRELVELICQEMNKDFNEIVEVSPDRVGKDQAYLMNADKAKSTLGWSPKVSLVEGIQETILWLKQNIETIREMPTNYIHKE